MNIRIDLNHTPLDGESISFKAPCNASEISGLIIYYNDENGLSVSKEFTLNDAHGVNIGVLNNIFSEGAIVKVIIDTNANNAFVQNADTNAYLEGKLAEKYSPANKPSPSDIGAAKETHTHTKSQITDFPTSMTPTAHNHAASEITSGTLSSDRLPTVPVAKGGTGATTAANARTNLGIKSETWVCTLEDGSTVNKVVCLL